MAGHETTVHGAPVFERRFARCERISPYLIERSTPANAVPRREIGRSIQPSYSILSSNCAHVMFFMHSARAYPEVLLDVIEQLHAFFASAGVSVNANDRYIMATSPEIRDGMVIRALQDHHGLPLKETL